MGWKYERIGLGVSYIVMNNTNHGVADPEVHVDYVDAKGGVVVSIDHTTDVDLAPGDMASDYASPPGTTDDLIRLAQHIVGANAVLTGSTKAQVAVSPVVVKDLRAEPVADVAYGGTRVVGTLVNTGDVSQDISAIHAIVLDEAGRADPQLLDTTSLIRIRPGQELPFGVRTIIPGAPAERFRVAVVSRLSRPPSTARVEVSPVTAFIAPISRADEKRQNLEVVGELTNTGDDDVAVPLGAVMCVVRDTSGAVVDLEPAYAGSYVSVGWLSVDMEKGFGPGATVPFACGNFGVPLAIPGFGENIGAYTVDVIAQPEAFNTSVAVFEPTLVAAATSVTITARHASVVVTFANDQPTPSTATVQARIYDSATGRLLSFTTEMYMIVVKGNGVYNIPPGASVSINVPVDLPPGSGPSAVRVETTAELGPDFTG